MSAAEIAWFRQGTPAHRILEALHEHGVVVLPDHIGPSEVARLNREFDEILGARPQEARLERLSGAARTISLRRGEMAGAEGRAVWSAFEGPLVHGMASGFFGPSGYVLGDAVSLNEHAGTPMPPGILPFVTHFDKHRRLNFLIYLTGTTVENGALQAMPGSHRENGTARERARRAGRSPSEVASLVECDSLIPIEGGAGAMVVFDSDVTHRAGHVRPGLVRRAIRGHAWAVHRT
jgi:hypothetical protein